MDPLNSANTNLIMYLSEIMVTRLKTENIFPDDSPDTLTARMRDDVKDSAEYAFFMASVFPEHLANNGFLGYYLDAGTSLYFILGRHPEGPVEQMNYRRLSHGFERYCRITHEICAPALDYELTDSGLFVKNLQFN